MVAAALTLLFLTSVRYGLATPIIDPALSEIIIQKGESTSLTCYGNTTVKWEFTNRQRKPIQQGNTTVVKIEQATYKDTGTYKCVYDTSNSSESASVHLFVKDPSEYWNTLKSRVIVYEETNADLPCLLTDPSVPNSMISLKLPENLKKTPETSFNPKTGFTIHNVLLDYNGKYVCQANVNGVQKSKEIYLIVNQVPREPPSVKLESEKLIRIQGEDFQLKCTVTSSVKPSIKWEHTRKNVTKDLRFNYLESTWIADSTMRIPSVGFDDSGDYACIGENRGGSTKVSANLQVIEKSFVNMSTSQNTSIFLNEGDSVELTVDIEAYPNLLSWRWEHINPDNADNGSHIPVQGKLQPNGPYRNRSSLTLTRLKKNESGRYTLYANNSNTSSSLTFQITLFRSPTVKIDPHTFHSKKIICKAWGIPVPTVQWGKCSTISCKDPVMGNVTEELKDNLVISVLQLGENIGNSSIYCLASNSVGNESAEMSFTNTLLAVTGPNEHILFNPLVTTLAVIGSLLLLITVILSYKYQKKPKYEVRWQIVQASEGNNYTCIDPSQLPYNEKWEFPRTNLQFGKTIGAGAFGKVMEATAFGMGKDDSALRVAVKMLKPSAHSDEMEALMSELKILSHLGNHQNIVNLLGACTAGGPILVITEYCQHGDLLNFLRRKAEAMDIVFTAGLAESTSDYKNMSLGQRYVSDSGFGNKDNSRNIDMKPFPANTKSQKGDALEEEEDMDDYLPLDLHDLMNFSLQVAQGMSFLASKNCIHRDVAARNVLVTQGRLAKICDFGLARDIENDSNYVVKGNARLPVKWMAPESIFDCIYTVQSDVWSYGILLWEIYSLGRSPYSGIIVNRKFYKMVKDGYKMDCPDYAPTEIYRLMKACWNLEPTQRPTFSQIADLISRQMSLIKDQEYANIIQGQEEEQCTDIKCVDLQEPLIKGNNYQFR